MRVQPRMMRVYPLRVQPRTHTLRVQACARCVRVHVYVCMCMCVVLLFACTHDTWKAEHWKTLSNCTALLPLKAPSVDSQAV